MHLTLILLALLIAAATSAQSQQPNRKPALQSQPGRSTQATSNDKRGTDEAPLAVKVVPAPKTETETAAEQANQKQKHATEARRRLTRRPAALTAVAPSRYEGGAPP